MTEVKKHKILNWFLFTISGVLLTLLLTSLYTKTTTFVETPGKNKEIIEKHDAEILSIKSLYEKNVVIDQKLTDAIIKINSRQDYQDESFSDFRDEVRANIRDMNDAVNRHIRSDQLTNNN